MMSDVTPTQSSSIAAKPYPVKEIRKQFPILQEKVRGRDLVYLDNAATSQKPLQVIEAIEYYYTTQNSNVHRGVHTLSDRATNAFEGAREKIQGFLGARSKNEIVFVRGTSEAINLVASSLGQLLINEGDEILISLMEHHSNIVPWQMLCERTGANLKVVPVNDKGELDLVAFDKLLTEKTKIVSLIHVSNALGTINPIKELVAKAKQAGAVTVVDGAQATPHMAVDVVDLDCDFYAVSAHKMYGPTGIGVLYGKESWLEKMPPYQGGGEMIRHVTFGRTLYAPPPHKFEAGTPNIAGAVGMGAAIDYLGTIGLEAIAQHENDLLQYGTEKLASIEGLRLIGTAAKKASVLSFVLANIHAHDIGTILDSEGIAVRTGHHCAQPVMDRFRVPATARASMALYNTRSEIDALVAGLAKVHEVFG